MPLSYVRSASQHVSPVRAGQVEAHPRVADRHQRHVLTLRGPHHPKRHHLEPRGVLEDALGREEVRGGPPSAELERGLPDIEAGHL